MKRLGLQQWIKENRLNATLVKPTYKYHYEGEEVKIRLIKIAGGAKYLVIEHSDVMFDSDFKLIMFPFEHKAFAQEYCDEVLFSFGNRWYHSELDEKCMNEANLYRKRMSDFFENNVHELNLENLSKLKK